MGFLLRKPLRKLEHRLWEGKTVAEAFTLQMQRRSAEPVHVEAPPGGGAAGRAKDMPLVRKITRARTRILLILLTDSD